ncbi:hypothetical protein GCM10010112_13280 [Actinoplanes lobatus]|nr:hypothetical protein GCM10010112_13280 [Actinoplanes lobatus]
MWVRRASSGRIRVGPSAIATIALAAPSRIAQDISDIKDNATGAESINRRIGALDRVTWARARIAVEINCPLARTRWP